MIVVKLGPVLTFWFFWGRSGWGWIGDRGHLYKKWRKEMEKRGGEGLFFDDLCVCLYLSLYTHIFIYII